MKTKKLYKFLREGLKSNSGETVWKMGEWKKETDISICNKGFHASQTIYHAFSYVQGEILAEVEVRGESVIQEDKECWSEMRIVKAWHWQKEDSVVLSIFAAELCIENFEKLYPDDKRPREAIEAAKAYLKDPSEKNRSAAWSAARSAERSARSAARSAERSAAWSAESAASAAWSAESAARSAERSAAESAAFALIISKINTFFKARLKTLKKYK